MHHAKQTILIADDSEMNRAILAEMLGSDYNILEAESGLEAVNIMQRRADIDLLMLDIVMPQMDGFDVLAMMNRSGWIEDIPVIMISAENGSAYVERAYDLGVTDYISRPFDMAIVRRRVVNTLLLYSKQKRLARLVAEQVYEKEKSNSMMINILSHIVEFRNGESGLHVLHIHTATNMLLHHLVKKTDRYNITAEDIKRISTASALHDIGKINIPEHILNKPGRLTPEEFEVIKTHSAIGAKILKDLPAYQNDPLMKTAYDICRWHHERYDGRGYPDGLIGEQIPISAQVVAMADVYDALTSERCYKKAYDHETAMKMILNGECGAFNPLLLECLVEIGPELHDALKINSASQNYLAEDIHLSDEVLNGPLTHQEHIYSMLDAEQDKLDFFWEHTPAIQFEYNAVTETITLSDWGVAHTQCQKTSILATEGCSFLSKDDYLRFNRAVRATTPSSPNTELTAAITVDGVCRRHKIAARSLWTHGDAPALLGAVAQAEDIHDQPLD